MNRVLFIIQFDSFAKTLIPTIKNLIKDDYRCDVVLLKKRFKKGWITDQFKSARYLNHGRDIFALCSKLISKVQFKCGVFQVQVTAMKPRPINLQHDIFYHSESKRKILDSAVDKINQRYGELTIAPARIISKLESPDVISPSWRPKGHRKSI